LERLKVNWESFESGADFRECSEAFCVQQANRIFARYALGDRDGLLKAMEDRDDPRLRTYCVHRFRESRTAIAPLISHILSDNIKADVLYGLLMIVAVAESNVVNPNSLTLLENWVLRQYENHPDNGVHGMCRYLVTKWQLHDQIEDADKRLMQAGIMRDKSWFVNSQGMHMAIIPGNIRFWMGPPKGEISEITLEVEAGREVSIGGDYAIGMDEVTIEQLQKFKPVAAPTESMQSPANKVSWIEGMTFCNWLNKQEKLIEFQWSVNHRRSPPDIILEGLKSVKQYRFPTCEEWEYASRAKTTTPRFNGTVNTPFSDGVLSEIDAKQVLPNRWGLKDTLASQAEWTISREPSFDPADRSQVHYFMIRDKVQPNSKDRTSSLSMALPSAQLGMRIVLCLSEIN
jgi:formylglycine-generating enzyme required for sulfatase activity